MAYTTNLTWNEQISHDSIATAHENTRVSKFSVQVIDHIDLEKTIYYGSDLHFRTL